MLARCSLLNTSRTDSISKSAPLTSVGRSRMWRILEEGKDARAAEAALIVYVCTVSPATMGDVSGQGKSLAELTARSIPGSSPPPKVTHKLVPSEMRARMTTSCSTSGSSRPCVLSTWMTGTPVLERPVRRPSRSVNPVTPEPAVKPCSSSASKRHSVGSTVADTSTIPAIEADGNSSTSLTTAFSFVPAHDSKVTTRTDCNNMRMGVES